MAPSAMPWSASRGQHEPCAGRRPARGGRVERPRRGSRSVAQTRRDKRHTHRERRIDGGEDGEHGRGTFPGSRRERERQAVRPRHLATSVFTARRGGHALGSPPALVSVPLQRPGKRPALRHGGGATGLGRAQGRSWQSGRRRRGRHAPPGSQREAGTGPRATGARGADSGRTEG